jgi:hypothetical protein
MCDSGQAFRPTSEKPLFHLGGFMRTTFLLPLTALCAVATGCGSETAKPAGSGSQRDLTLMTQTSGVQIASRLETQQLPSPPQAIHQTRRVARSTPARRSSPQATVKLAVMPATAPVPEPVVQPATAPTPQNDRELLPGKTITLIPASSGSSAGPDETAEFPEVRGRTVVARGGTCGGRGRGPGIGIATRPRPDFR